MTEKGGPAVQSRARSTVLAAGDPDRKTIIRVNSRGIGAGC